MHLALHCARARVGYYWGEGSAQRVVNVTERMTCCCGVLRPCLPAPLNCMGSSQDAPSSSTGGAQLEAAGRHVSTIFYQYHSGVLASQCVAAVRRIASQKRDCGKGPGSSFQHGICSHALSLS